MSKMNPIERTDRQSTAFLESRIGRYLMVDIALRCQGDAAQKARIIPSVAAWVEGSEALSRVDFPLILGGVHLKIFDSKAGKVKS